MSEPIHIISLGAGVQSSTMALMAAAGEITPMPVAAIFADTKEEPDEVYDWIRYLQPRLPFKIHIVGEESPLSLAMFIRGAWRSNGEKSYVGIPSFTAKGGFSQRRCTKYGKLIPIRREARRIANGAKVKMWIGISTDEISRVKDTGLKWIENTHPLIDLRMSREDCLSWMRKHNYGIPPKSACIFCPFNSNRMWRRFIGTRYWERICLIDDELNKRGEFLHKSLKPIREVDFSTEEERGQLNMFNNECEGMCGV